MSHFDATKLPTIIILQVLLEIILDEVYGVIAKVLLKMYSNSCCKYIYLPDYLVWGIITTSFFLRMSCQYGNLFIHSNKWSTIPSQVFL